MCVRKLLAMSEALHVSFMGTSVCSPLSNATFILTASGPEGRRGLTLMLKKLYLYIKVHRLVSSSVFLSLRELLRALASSSWAGLVLSCVLHAAAAHQDSTQWGSRSAHDFAQLHQRCCSKQAVAYLLLHGEIQVESPNPHPVVPIQ